MPICPECVGEDLRRTPLEPSREEPCCLGLSPASRDHSERGKPAPEGAPGQGRWGAGVPLPLDVWQPLEATGGTWLFLEPRSH